MTANQAFPVKAMCEAFGVSRSGFYAWRDRRPCGRALEDALLAKRITAIHAASRQTYGAPRVHAELAHEGLHIGRKRVERLMKAGGLAGVSRRRSARTTIRDERVRPASDLVDRNFYAEAPKRRTGSGLPTSPMSRPGRASSIWPWFWMPSLGASSDGRWPMISGRNSLSTR